MVRTFLVSMFAILLFTLGATASWFYVNMMEERKAEAADAESMEETLPSITTTDPLSVPTLDSPSREMPALPAPVRGPDLDPEEIYRIKLANEATRDLMRQDEEQLRELQLRIRASNADAKTARREVEGTLEQVRNLLEATEAVLTDTKKELEELRKERAEVERKSKALDEQQTEAGADVANRMKVFSETMASMPATDVAESLKAMINSGKMDFVIQLLQKMETRDASKILSEFKDPDLVAEIASRYPTAPATR